MGSIHIKSNRENCMNQESTMANLSQITMIPTIVLTLLFLTTALSETVTISAMKAVRRPKFDNKRITDPGYTIEEFLDNGSAIMCVHRCNLQANCYSISYNRISAKCMLYSAVFHDGGCNTVNETGWGYYICSHTDCPTELGFVEDRQNGLCAYISFEKQAYTNRKDTCESMGALLVSLDTASKLAAMKRLLDTLSESQYDFAIGLDKSSGSWIWINGHTLDSQLADWHPGQPYCPFSGGCACAYMLKDWKWRWNDSKCSDNAYFICEYNPNSHHTG